MRQSVQRAAIKDIVSVERPLWILAEWIPPVAHFQRFLAAVRVRAQSSTADRVPANLPTVPSTYLTRMYVRYALLLRLNESCWHRNRHKRFTVSAKYTYFYKYSGITSC